MEKIKTIASKKLQFTMEFKNGRVHAPSNAKVALVDHPLVSDFANVLILSNYEYKKDEAKIPPIIFFTKEPSCKWNSAFMDHIIDECEKVVPELKCIRETEVVEKNGHYINGNDEKSLQDFLDSPKILAYPLHGELPAEYEVIYNDSETEELVNELYEAAVWNKIYNVTSATLREVQQS